jgi:hypothetical protein
VLTSASETTQSLYLQSRRMFKPLRVHHVSLSTDRAHTSDTPEF